MDNFKPDHGEDLTGRERVQLGAILLTAPVIIMVPTVLSRWYGCSWAPYEWSERIYETWLFVIWLAGTTSEWYRWKTYEQKQGKRDLKTYALVILIFSIVTMFLMTVVLLLQYEFPVPFNDISWRLTWKTVLPVLVLAGVFAVISCRGWLTYNNKKN